MGLSHSRTSLVFGQSNLYVLRDQVDRLLETQPEPQMQAARLILCGFFKSLMSHQHGLAPLLPY
jgi:hypothetical protein